MNYVKNFDGVQCWKATTLKTKKRGERIILKLVVNK
jgi:hypothetical protein